MMFLEYDPFIAYTIVYIDGVPVSKVKANLEDISNAIMEYAQDFNIYDVTVSAPFYFMIELRKRLSELDTENLIVLKG